MPEDLHKMGMSETAGYKKRAKGGSSKIYLKQKKNKQNWGSLHFIGRKCKRETNRDSQVFMTRIYLLYSTFLIEDTENLGFHRIFWILLHVKL